MKKFNNADFKFKTLELGGRKILFTLPNVGCGCWTLSLENALGPMLREEIGREHRGIKAVIYKLFSFLVEKIARVFCVDNLAFANHFGFSTSIYERGDISTILQNIDSLKGQFKKRAIVLRGLHAANFRGRFQKYRLIPSRVIWVMEDAKSQFLSHKDGRRDMRLMSKFDLSLDCKKGVIENEILKRCKKLYDDLYLIKYSKCNPDITIEYMDLLARKGVLDFYLVRDVKNEIIAFCAIHKNNNSMCSPLLGYEPTSSLPLYRIIMSVLPQIAMQENLFLNNSAGAPIFKHNRGSTPLMEYMLIIDDHLPIFRRFGYWLIGFILLRFENQLWKAAKIV